MRRLEFSLTAQQDFETIAEYIAEQSGRETAVAVATKLRERCERLARLPGTLGTARPDLAPNLRSTPHRGYIIYFRYSGDTLEIVNVLDAHRDTLAYFGEDGPEI